LGVRDPKPLRPSLELRAGRNRRPEADGKLRGELLDGLDAFGQPRAASPEERLDGAALVGFVAYRAKDADLTRWRVTPVARLQDLGALPTWLRERPAQA